MLPRLFRVQQVVRPTIFLVSIVMVALLCTVAPSFAAEPEILVRVTNAYPCWAPHSSRICYESTADGDFDVYVVDLEKGTRRKLTDSPGRDGTPVWSPDGTRIAFMSDRDGHRQVYVMNADGTNQEDLSHNDFVEEHPFWSADGTRILFVSNRDTDPNNLDIWSMAADGSDAQRIAATPQVETYASWSPDDSKIVCRRMLTEDDWAVIVMNADGTNDRDIAPSPGVDAWPVWTPDGKRIVFASDRSGKSCDLWVVDANGGEPERLTFDDQRDERQPCVAPSGDHVVYASYVWYPGQPFYEASEILGIRIGE